MNIKGYFNRYIVYAKSAGTYLAATIISSLIGVLINPLLALNLSPEDYATIGYYSAYSNFLSPIIGFFLIDYFLKNRYLLDGDNLNRLRATVIKLLLLFSLMVTIPCIIGLYVYIYQADVSIPFFPYAILSIVQTYMTFIYSFRAAEHKINNEPGKFFNLSVSFGVINAIVALLFVVTFKWGAVGKMSGMLLVSLCFFIYILFKYKDLLKIPIDKSHLQPIIKYSSPLVLAGMLGFFTNGVDRILLEREGNIYMLGVYSVAVQMAGYVNIFATSIKSTFQPDAYKAMAAHDIKKSVKVILISTGLVALVVLAFIIFCPIIIHLLTAGRYDESTGLARILSLSAVTSSFYFLISQFTYGSGLSYITLANKIISAPLSIIIFILLISAYGAYGAAWGVVIGFVVSAITNLILLYINRHKIL